MADTYQVPQASDAVTAYAPGFKTGHLFDVPAVSNSLVMYAPEFSAQQVDRYVVPEAVCDLTVTAPIFYTSETVTAGCYAVWLYIDGVDVTQYLAGGVQVTEKENASTLAGFDLTFGPTVSPGQVFQFVVYDGTNTKALFVGKLSKCEPQPDSGIITCSATNDLQNAVRDLTEDELNTLTGGYFHKEISRTEGDRWERFQQLLETVPKESHICHDGALVCVDWAAKGTADVQHTNATRYTKTLRGTVAQSSGIVNRNRVTVQHKFTRRKLRTIGCSWAIPHRENIRYYLDQSWPLPNQEAARSALDGCGWEVKNLSFTPPWHHYHFGNIYRYNDYSGGTLGTGGIVIDWADDLIIGFGATLAKTWDQTHINDYVFDVRSNTSITALGERGVDEHWGIEAERAEVVEETTGHGALYTSGRGTQPVGSLVTSGSESELEAGQELSNGDWYYDDISAETDLEGAIATAVNRATTEILATHRDHSEYFEVPFSHANTLANTTRLVGDVTCKGKNRSLVHKIDPVAGSASTLIEVAISGLEGQGVDVAEPLDAIVPAVNDPLGSSASVVVQTLIGGDYSSPPKPEGEISAVFSDYDWTEDPPDGDPELNMYGKSVEIHTPDIGDSDVDDREQTIAKTLVVDVPIDEYSLVYSGAC